MKLKTINNSKGSALLWVILMTVIITILLGSMTIASATYFNYTMFSVKRQQAYFTARSAMNILLEKASEQSVVENEDGTTVDVASAILPEAGKIKHITSFEFGDNMGTAEAWIARGDVKDPEKESLSNIEAENYATIKVIAKYADQEYTMTSTIANQPLYFAGIAIKNLAKAAGSSQASLKLGNNTDLYYNNTNTFDTTGLGCDIEIGGSLVTKGDAIIGANTTVSGHPLSDTNNVKFFKTTTDGKPDYSFTRKIWNASEYIISNKTLLCFENSEDNEYQSSTFKTLKSLLNNTSTYTWCENRDYSFEYYDIEFKSGSWFPRLTKKQYNSADYFGGSTIISNVAKGIGGQFASGIDSIFSGIVPSGLSLTSLYVDSATSGMCLDKQSNDSLAVQYIKVMCNNKVFGNLAANIKDISYIGYSSRGTNNVSDRVVPVTYLLIPDASNSIFGGTGQPNPVCTRIMFGSNPGKLNDLLEWTNSIRTDITNVIDTIFDRNNTPAYTITYVGSGSTLELGINDRYIIGGLGGQNAKAMYSSAKEDGSLIFPFSIYGEEGSTVILHDGVTVLGEICVDNLIIDGDVNVIYSTSSGSQIAKQKVANIWSVSKFDD